MKMNLKNLLNDGSIEEFQSNSDQIKDKINIAERDLAAAKKIGALNDSDTDDTAYNAAYNAMLQSSTALMYKNGYRSKDRSKHHYTTIEFIKIVYSGKIPHDAILAFENARSTRNKLQYDTAGIITNSNVLFLIQKADIFVTSAKKFLE